MPKLVQFPEPKKRFHGGRWRIYWYWKRNLYSIPTNFFDPDDSLYVDLDLRRISSSLTSPDVGFPDEYGDTDAVRQYIHDVAQSDDGGDLDGDWVASYMSTLRTTASSAWQKHTLRYLQALDRFAGDIKRVSANQAQEFLNGVIHSGNKPATRNKALAVCSKFFKWAKRTRRVARNPFEGIKQLREEKSSAIMYSTRDERDAIIALAKATGWHDWIAVPIAYYSGLRRGEIAALEWPDVRFAEGIIAVQKSKTGRSREAPLHSALENLLKSIPESQRIGYVVPMPHDQDRLDRLTNLVKRIRDDREAQLMAEWSTPKPVFEFKNTEYTRAQFREDVKRYNAARKERKREIARHLDTITWNPFRHTFASLLVQSGVDIDTVTSWMGNTPEVCRRHYAQFIPRDRRDERIERI